VPRWGERWANVEKGPLRRAIEAGARITGEVAAALYALEQIAREHELWDLPPGEWIELELAEAKAVMAEVAKVLDVLSEGARDTLVFTLYHTGNDEVARALGVPPVEEGKEKIH
jgi:hypothetical protein